MLGVWCGVQVQNWLAATYEAFGQPVGQYYDIQRRRMLVAPSLVPTDALNELNQLEPGCWWCLLVLSVVARAESAPHWECYGCAAASSSQHLVSPVAGQGWPVISPYLATARLDLRVLPAATGSLF